MTARQLTVAALALVVAACAALITGCGGGEDDRYAVRLNLENALGLRDGSLVTVGGVKVGTVEVKLGDDDRVRVEARLDEGKGPVGRGARAYITSVNLLGQKRLELDTGDLERPLPSGSAIPRGRVVTSTDLDQVLAVLTPDVRGRLNVLLNEAATAVVGRDADIAQLTGTLAPTIQKATRTLDAIVGDTRTLGRLVANSDALVSEVTAERRALGELVDSAGQAAASVATKRAELRETLRRAPGTLATLRRFLGELEATTVPLGPAARDIAATAPELRRTLDEIEPFQAAAAPTLRQAVDTAPQLTRLAQGATPVLRRAVPTLSRLAQLSADAVPVTDTLDKSVHNLIGTIDNWSRAVQYRDGLSHIFRGEAAVTPQTLESLLNNLNPAQKAKARRKRTAGRRGPQRETVPAPQAREGEKPKRVIPKLPIVGKLPPQLAQAVEKALDGVDGAVSGLVPRGAQPEDQQGRSLLDFLLK